MTTVLDTDFEIVLLRELDSKNNIRGDGEGGKQHLRRDFVGGFNIFAKACNIDPLKSIPPSRLPMKSWTTLVILIWSTSQAVICEARHIPFF